MGAMTNYLENKIQDQLWRGQAFTFPGTLYFALMTVAATEAGGGTEVSGGGYARVAMVCSLANFSGTQGAGTTAASSGTGGQISNNVPITFPAPTANWGTVVAMAVFDAASGGNMLWQSPLVSSKTINNGDAAPAWNAAQFTATVNT